MGKLNRERPHVPVGSGIVITLAVTIGNRAHDPAREWIYEGVLKPVRITHRVDGSQTSRGGVGSEFVTAVAIVGHNNGCGGCRVVGVTEGYGMRRYAPASARRERLHRFNKCACRQAQYSVALWEAGDAWATSHVSAPGGSWSREKHRAVLDLRGGRQHIGGGTIVRGSEFSGIGNEFDFIRCARCPHAA